MRNRSESFLGGEVGMTARSLGTLLIVDVELNNAGVLDDLMKAATRAAYKRAVELR